MSLNSADINCQELMKYYHFVYTLGFFIATFTELSGMFCTATSTFVVADVRTAITTRTSITSPIKDLLIKSIFFDCYDLTASSMKLIKSFTNTVPKSSI